MSYSNKMTLCNGVNCPYEHLCQRKLLIQFSIYDINTVIFKESPYDKVSKNCEFFIPNKQTKLDL